MNDHLLLILSGGLGTPTAVFLVARALVHGHGDPAAAEAYYAARRAEQAAAERAAQLAILRTRQRTALRMAPKELTR
ncbi:hypothetical protein [Micromonospora rubida]|uniref:hypothetical protein n=1 Tax=Micromonospora rubida TaxID=2697657 RepID=UPI0013776136|nr:hypothetical protein [Micromonospora rubida]NBE80287.1 hypothetical protein [Micromonospora rubida]